MSDMKDSLLAEKKELGIMIERTPADQIINKITFEARLKRINEDLFNLEKSERVAELEAINAELLDALEDFIIAVGGYFGYRESDDIQPEDDVAYFIGEYRRAKQLINKAKREK